MTEMCINPNIHEFVAVCYEYPNLYHERQYKLSKWAGTMCVKKAREQLRQRKNGGERNRFLAH